MRSIHVHRSMLSVPVHIERFVEKAPLCGADALMLDLEDSVPMRLKDAARAALPRAVEVAGRGGAELIVRINKPWELTYRDLDAAVMPGVAGILLPKVEAPEDVVAIDRLIEEREFRAGLEPRSIYLFVATETARGLLRDVDIATASPRIRYISSGVEDLATDLEVELTDDAWELFYSKARIIIVAVGAGLEPIGLLGRVSDYTDLESFRRTALRSRRLGFRGGTCIHPAQVPILNEVFTPTAEEVAKATRIISAAEAAESAGRGAFGLNGQMMDIPSVERARRLLDRAHAIRERSATL